MTIEESTARILAAKAKLDEFRVGAWLRAESSMVPRWKRKPRSFRTLPDGQVTVTGEAHTVRTQYLRSNYNASDVALLEQIVEAQPKVFTFDQSMAGRKFKGTADQVERIRKGQL